MITIVIVMLIRTTIIVSFEFTNTPTYIRPTNTHICIMQHFWDL